MSRFSDAYSFSLNLKSTFLNNLSPVVVQNILIKNCRTINVSRKPYNINDGSLITLKITMTSNYELL